MQIVAYLLAAALGFFGLVFIVGSQGQVLRIVVGVVLFAGAAVLVFLVRVRPQPSQTNVTVTQKIELSGDVSAQNLTCKNCGGRLTEKSVSVKAGAVFITCEFCGTAYQLEEAPKW